jgi:hypothetical protein
MRPHRLKATLTSIVLSLLLLKTCGQPYFSQTRLLRNENTGNRAQILRVWQSSLTSRSRPATVPPLFGARMPRERRCRRQDATLPIGPTTGSSQGREAPWAASLRYASWEWCWPAWPQPGARVRATTTELWRAIAVRNSRPSRPVLEPVPRCRAPRGTTHPRAAARASRLRAGYLPTRSRSLRRTQ